MGVRAMAAYCLCAAILGSFMIAWGYTNPLLIILTLVCWIFAIVGYLMRS